MRKIALVLIVVAFVAGTAFAQGAADTSAKPTVGQQAKDMVGKVVNVTMAEPAQGIANGTVTVMDDTGKAVNFTVTQSTKVLDTALNVITLNQLKIGEKVDVQTKEGKEASSISVVK